MSDNSIGELPDKELLNKIRGYVVGDVRRKEFQAEFDLRQSRKNARYTLFAIIAAAISAGGSMIAAIASLFAIHSK